MPTLPRHTQVSTLGHANLAVAVVTAVVAPLNVPPLTPAGEHASAIAAPYYLEVPTQVPGSKAMLASWTAAMWLHLASVTAHVVFLALLPYHLARLHRAAIKVHPNWRGHLKALGQPLYASLQLLVLVLLLTHGSSSSREIVESALSLVASWGLLVLSPLAHRRSLSPSTPITAYLLAKFICYSLCFPIKGSSLGRAYSMVISAQLLFTLVLLLLELQSKRPALLQAYAHQPPEAVTSFIGNWFFLWMNPVLRKGYTKLLAEDDIPNLDEELSSKGLRLAIRIAWDARARPENGTTLPRVLLGCLLSPFLAAIIPRIFVVLFRFAQPLLISQAIRFVTKPRLEAHHEPAYWIIIAAATVYTGVAVSTSIYRHRLNRLHVMIRGTLIGLLHSHALETRGSDEDDGKAVTLMSNDIGNVQNSGEVFHETWGQFIEVVVGTVLLATRIGWLWPLPLVLIFLCSRMSLYVAKTLKPAQGKWNKATQQRISVINSVLGCVKNIKMLGLQQSVTSHVEELRDQEMNAAAGVRWLSVAYNASANALGMFAPVFTIVVYAGVAHSRGERLDTETAFTSIAILAMITHPANMVMTMVPRAVVAYSSFERIQMYLLEKGRGGTPLVLEDHANYPPGKPEDGVAISLENISITDFVTSKLILRDINLKVPHGAVVILTGPVGSGKSIVTRAILGDIATSLGSVQVATGRIAYCSQSPWLPNRTIRDAICRPTVEDRWDETWYQKSIQACCLESDIDDLPDGDSTVVGSKGMNLSGGQKQRVALARAVYSRARLVLLDDSFSALDGKTQDQVIHNLLGRDGIFRKLGVTVVWCTTATRMFRFANEVIVISDGTIKEKGTWDQLRKEDPLLDEILHPHDKSPANDAGQMPKEERSLLAAKGAGSGDAHRADLARKNGDLSLYSYYCRAAGLVNIVSLASCAILYGFFITFPPYWLKWWTESSQSSSRTGFYMAGYLILLLLAYTTTLSGIYITVLRIAPTSGLTLHQRLLTAVMGAPLLYFSQTNTGTILNRFSEDIQLVDKSLADAWSTLNIQVFKLLVQACLIFASQPLMTLSLPFSVAIVYIVQKVYLRTSRQLRILELESRAAVFSNFLETIQGATTIRAFGWEQPWAEENIATLDGSQRPFYLLFCLRRWLNVVLDLIIAGIAVGTIWLAVVFRGSTTGGQIGVALNVILVANSTLLKLVESWTDLEISLGAVARLKEVDTTTPAEEEQRPQQGGAQRHDDDQAPTRHWPSAGTIEFNDVSASYNPNHTPPVLHHLNLRIQPGQTVVICGRTGSGKSSLLLALLRLLDTDQGSITVDGVDIAWSSKAILREKAFITVAQEAFFLPQASLRYNLDPELKAAPSSIVAALVKTGLWGHFLTAHHRQGPPSTKLVGRGRQVDEEEEEVEPLLTARDDDGESSEGKTQSHLLSTPLSALPALSAGQTQLLALARALVRKHVLTTTAAAAAATTNNLPSYTTFPEFSDNSNTSESAVFPPATASFSTEVKPIILLDEVTSSLDPSTEAKIYNVLEQEFVQHGHTVVMVTHKLEGIRGRLRKGRDAIVWMANGEISRSDAV